MLAAMQRLIESFAMRSSDRTTLDELLLLTSNRGHWKRARDLFQRIRRKNLDAERQGEAELVAQFAFEEACAKTLYNLSGERAPFDADSPYWIVPNALAAAKLLEIDETVIIKAIT